MMTIGLGDSNLGQFRSAIGLNRPFPLAPKALPHKVKTIGVDWCFGVCELG